MLKLGKPNIQDQSNGLMNKVCVSNIFYNLIMCAEDVKNDDYRLGLLKMKFNNMSQTLKDYIQKEDPDLFNKIKTVSRLKVI